MARTTIAAARTARTLGAAATLVRRQTERGEIPAFTHFVTVSNRSGLVLHIVKTRMGRRTTRCGVKAVHKADHRRGALICRACATSGNGVLWPLNTRTAQVIDTAVRIAENAGDRHTADALRHAGIVFGGTAASLGQYRTAAHIAAGHDGDYRIVSLTIDLANRRH